MWRVFVAIVWSGVVCSRAPQKTTPRPRGNDLSLWIDEHQVKLFSGMNMEIYCIADGKVMPFILDPNFEKYLPVIPSEVGYVNFTWKSGTKRYYYNFDRLQTFDEGVLEPPMISINVSGRVPRNPKVFSVQLPCSGKGTGIAPFGIGLLIESRKGRPLPGTPLRLRLRKECVERGNHHQSLKSLEQTPTAGNKGSSRAPDPECDKKCANGGWCNNEKLCQCPEGYMGQHCKTALCYPQCMHGGNCTAPGVCSCPPGFQGRHCEGGICSEKCLNGGKCVQKDTCGCPKGYYGLRCEYSKCIVPCTNGGRCRDVNKCKCPPNFRGDHCERRISMPKSRCNRPCRHGVCRGDTCHCHHGWAGRVCNQRIRPIVDDYDGDEDDEDEEEEKTVRTRIYRKRIDV